MSIPAAGQINNSLYFMPGVPQANRINPAIQPKCTFYLGFPLLAPARVELSSSALAFEDVIYYNSEIDSLITFLHPLGSKEDFLNELKPVNFIVSDLGTSLASFGFRAGENFFSVDVTTRIEGDIYYPLDIFNLIFYGAEDGETFEFDGIAADITAFDEVSVGWSRSILSNLDIGARAKILFGVGNLTTTESDLNLSTSQDLWTIQSNMEFNASLPFADVIYDSEGNIEEIVIKDDLENFKPSSLPPYMFNFQNLGFAFDIGVNYRPIDPLLISASVTDIGFIKWKDEVHRGTYDMTYDFAGLEINPFDFSEDYTFEDYLDSTLTSITDSLMNFLVLSPSGGYSKRMNTKLYVGASYFVTPNINFGLLSRTDFLNDKIAQQVTASANFTTGRFVNLTLSYSYRNNYFKNFGAGLSFNVGPLNMYLISDNALNVVFWPQEAQSANLWFGLNLVFGYKKFMVTEIKDKPLVY